MKKDRGFSLIEMLVVVAILAVITMTALPSISSYFKISMSAAGREMATTIKEAYNATAITGKIHRLVYDLKENQYWVESGPPTALLDTKESKEKAERKLRFGFMKEPPRSPFSLEKTVTRKKLSLPRGIEFEDILTQQNPEPISEGMAYTHFFPHGVTEQTIIHLKDESNHRASLVISPLIGNSDLYERYVTRAELSGS